MVCVAYFTESNVEICNYGKNNAFVTEIANMRLMKVFMVIFSLAEMLPTSATLAPGILAICPVDKNRNSKTKN